MSPTSTNVDSLRNDMCEHVFNREDVNNTYKSNGYIEFYFGDICLPLQQM